jgi:hypothetical protein
MNHDQKRGSPIKSNDKKGSSSIKSKQQKLDLPMKLTQQKRGSPIKSNQQKWYQPMKLTHEQKWDIPMKFPQQKWDMPMKFPQKWDLPMTSNSKNKNEKNETRSLPYLSLNMNEKNERDDEEMRKAKAKEEEEMRKAKEKEADDEFEREWQEGRRKKKEECLRKAASGKHSVNSWGEWGPCDEKNLEKKRMMISLNGDDCEEKVEWMDCFPERPNKKEEKDEIPCISDFGLSNVKNDQTLFRREIRKLTKQHHPDKGGDVEVFKALKNCEDEWNSLNAW